MQHPSIRLTVPIVLAAAFVGCTAISQERAVSIAIAEVARRGLSLPKHHLTVVTSSEVTPEFAPRYPIWCVAFSVPGAKKALYEVCIDKYTREIETFVDVRHLSPPQ